MSPFGQGVEVECQTRPVGTGGGGPGPRRARWKKNPHTLREVAPPRTAPPRTAPRRPARPRPRPHRHRSGGSSSPEPAPNRRPLRFPATAQAAGLCPAHRRLRPPASTWTGVQQPVEVPVIRARAASGRNRSRVPVPAPASAGGSWPGLRRSAEGCRVRSRQPRPASPAPGRARTRTAARSVPPAGPTAGPVPTAWCAARLESRGHRCPAALEPPGRPQVAGLGRPYAVTDRGLVAACFGSRPGPPMSARCARGPRR